MTQDYFTGDVAAHYDESTFPEFDPATIQLTVDFLAGLAGDGARYDRPVPAIEEIGRHTLSALNALPWRPRRVVCEPGRALVAESGVIASTVIGREQRFGTEWVYLDVGAYNGLMESAQTKATWAFLCSPLDSTAPSGRYGHDHRSDV